MSRAKSINERISLGEQDHATCKQEIIYSATGDKKLEFRGVFESQFHKDCDEFEISGVEGPITLQPLVIKVEPYQKRFSYEIRGSIPPGQDGRFTITYSWKGFRDREGGFKRIAAGFESLTNYSLRIEVSDNTFLNHLISIYDGDRALVRNDDYFVSEEGHLLIYRNNQSPNNRMDLRINASIIKIDLPVVGDTASGYKNSLSQKFAVLAILHLLRDSLPFFEGLLTMGLDKEDVFVVGIPYSSKEVVVEHLLCGGFRVKKADKIDYTNGFKGLVRDALIEALDYCRKTKKRLLIIEDGGYAVPLLHADPSFADELGLCFGAVEQTANGIWADKDLEDKGKLRFPVMNVAESRIKAIVESPLVGQAIVRNINHLLEVCGWGLTSMEVGQIGFGNIGKPLALQMKDDGVKLEVYDIEKDKRDDAERKGLRVAKSLDELLAGKNLIIGCSGKELVGLQELRQLDRDIFFVNATSKLRELKMKEFLDVTDKIRVRRGVGVEHRLKGGRRVKITLLANGFPVNFFESSESIPDKQIQFIPALLLAAAGYLVSKQLEGGRIFEIPEEIEENLKQTMRLHDETL